MRPYACVCVCVRVRACVSESNLRRQQTHGMNMAGKYCWVTYPNLFFL